MMKGQLGDTHRMGQSDRRGRKCIVADAVIDEGARGLCRLQLAEAVLDRDLEADDGAEQQLVVGIQKVLRALAESRGSPVTSHSRLGVSSSTLT